MVRQTETATRIQVPGSYSYPASGDAIPRELFAHVVDENRRLTEHNR